MKNRVIAFILIFILTCNVLIPKKVNATAVGTEVVIEVGTVLYYIIQGVITGVEVKTIVETISTGGERYTVYKKTNGSGTLYKFVNGNKTRIRPQVAQALVDGLTDKQLVELANNVTINEEGMMTSGDISDDTKKAVNGIMIDISGSVPMYENYYTDLVERRKTLSSSQLKEVRSIINQFAYSNLEQSDYKYPYFAIVPTFSLDKLTMSYRIYFSTVPLIVYNQSGRCIDIVPITNAMNGYVVGSSSCTVRPNLNSENFYVYTYEYDWMRQFGKIGQSFVFPINTFLENNITAIGHGIVELDYDTYSKLYANGSITYEDMKEAQNNVYEIPYSLANVEEPYTYIDKDKEAIVIKDGPLPVAGDIDKVVEQINDYENTDKNNHVTWDNIDSAINKNLIVGVIDEYYNPGIDIPIDTPTDLNGVNKRLDEVIEKLGAILGSLSNINSLTDQQLREILKDLDLTNTDGLTIDQVREYASEKELENEKELDSELDLDKYKMDTGIIAKFPFCVPYDLINMLKKLKRVGEPPRFEIPFTIKSIGVNETIIFDFKDYESVVVIVRWFLLFSFVASLILVTRKLIRG